MWTSAHVYRHTYVWNLITYVKNVVNNTPTLYGTNMSKCNFSSCECLLLYIPLTWWMTTYPLYHTVGEVRANTQQQYCAWYSYMVLLYVQKWPTIFSHNVHGLSHKTLRFCRVVWHKVSWLKMGDRFSINLWWKCCHVAKYCKNRKILVGKRTGKFCLKLCVICQIFPHQVLPVWFAKIFCVMVTDLSMWCYYWIIIV